MGSFKKKAALLAIGGQKLRELFSRLTPAEDSYEAVKTILTTRFMSKGNLTAERFKFFCIKPIDSNETYYHWMTRLRTRVKDCEFDKMGDDETIKLVIILHTHSEKLHSSIIQKNMDLAKLVSAAQSLELKNKVNFLKNNTLQSDTHIIEEDITIRRLNTQEPSLRWKRL